MQICGNELKGHSRCYFGKQNESFNTPEICTLQQAAEKEGKQG
jgi:hypothetical protein